jgi:hypothetical protein
MNARPIAASIVTMAALVAVALCQAARAQAPQPVWTPSANAPAGTLTHELEGRRHDRAIDLARQGGIDVVFFGTTGTEMWSWPDRGRGVWDRAFASIKAANFGSQGTQPKSLLWRMQNGELAGFRAKLVVLELSFNTSRTAAADGAATVRDWTPIVAEIRARQPQAKILFFAPFPRGEHARDDWRAIAKDEAAAFAQLVDDGTVFYADIGERFYRPDGSYDRDLFSPSGSAGMQPAAFEIWAEELRPWLDRFVR